MLKQVVVPVVQLKVVMIGVMMMDGVMIKVMMIKRYKKMMMILAGKCVVLQYAVYQPSFVPAVICSRYTSRTCLIH